MIELLFLAIVTVTAVMIISKHKDSGRDNRADRHTTKKPITKKAYSGKVNPHQNLVSEPESTRHNNIEHIMAQLEETFSQSLLKLIEQRGKDFAVIHKKAYIDRRLFSKIKCNPQYQPSKNTVISFAIALELNINETNDLLKKAGFALSRSIKFDVIIEYYINECVYDFFKINETLYAYNQSLLGSSQYINIIGISQKLVCTT